MKANASSYIVRSKPALEHVRVANTASDPVNIALVVEQWGEQGQVLLRGTTTPCFARAFGQTLGAPVVAHRCLLQPVVFS